MPLKRKRRKIIRDEKCDVITAPNLIIRLSREFSVAVLGSQQR